MKIEVRGFDRLQERLAKMQRDVSQASSQLNTTTVTTHLMADEKGFVDRSCLCCSFLFKVAAINCADVTTCPSCGHCDPKGQWATQVQRAHAMANARRHAEVVARSAFAGKPPAFPGFSPAFSNLRQTSFGMRGSIAQGVNLMREGRWVVVGIPAAASAALQSERTCLACACRFSFIVSAFFCPSCGVSSAEDNFDQSIAGVRRSIALLCVLRNSLSADDAANLERTLLEKATADLVTNFQLAGECVYYRKTGVAPPINAFQRLDGANSGDLLWRAATGRNYADYIGLEGFAKLRKYFQRRHVLAHKAGFIEQSYVIRSCDTEYAVGQRLVLRAYEIEEFTKLIESLIAGMRRG